ncbi:MAG: Fic family protein, partial [bacterium]|nr:Fic family protein [bacterium]
MNDLKIKYPHIKLERSWSITSKMHYMLGECNSLIKAIINTAIRPDYLESLQKEALIKGAQAATAIEGNSLSIEEIRNIQKGEKLPSSRDYLRIEVENMIESLNVILENVLVKNEIIVVTSELVKEFHWMVGKNLGDYFDSIPGQFRSNYLMVGSYQELDSQDVKILIDNLVTWLGEEFSSEENLTFSEVIIESIVTHVYIAWIRPFSDGNGRTARLLEFLLLLRSGVPGIASLSLMNFYNKTRSEYFRQIENATKKKDLTEFISYAIQGFRDELHEVLEALQENQLLITWENYVFGIFEEKTSVGKSREANKRRRNLLLEIPADRYLASEE